MITAHFSATEKQLCAIYLIQHPLLYHYFCIVNNGTVRGALSNLIHVEHTEQDWARVGDMHNYFILFQFKRMIK